MADIEYSFHYRSTMIDAEDGSGGCLLPIPDTLWKHLNWKLSDVLEISQRPDGSIVIYKAQTQKLMGEPTTRLTHLNLYRVLNIPINRSRTYLYS